MGIQCHAEQPCRVTFPTADHHPVGPSDGFGPRAFGNPRDRGRHRTSAHSGSDQSHRALHPAVNSDGFPVTLRVDKDGVFAWFGGLFRRVRLCHECNGLGPPGTLVRISDTDSQPEPREWVFESSSLHSSRPCLYHGYVVFFRRFRRHAHDVRQDRHLSSEALSNWESRELDPRSPKR
jgi:hypothetical protein